MTATTRPATSISVDTDVPSGCTTRATEPSKWYS